MAQSQETSKATTRCPSVNDTNNNKSLPDLNSNSTSIPSGDNHNNNDIKEATASKWTRRRRRWINAFSLQKAPPPPIPTEREMTHEYTAGILSKITFAWTKPLMKVGYVRPLEEMDIWSVRPDRTCRVVAAEIRKNLKLRLEEIERCSIQGKRSRLFWWKGRRRMTEEEKKKEYKHALRNALDMTLKKRMWITGVQHLFGIVGQALAAYLVRYLVQFAQDAYDASAKKTKPPNVGIGIGWVLGICIIQYLQRIVFAHSYYMLCVMAADMRGALSIMIFEKAMVISSRARAGNSFVDNEVKLPQKDVTKMQEWMEKLKQNKEKSAKTDKDGGWTDGQIFNLLVVHTGRFDIKLKNGHNIWGTPVNVLLTLILVLTNLGWPALPGIAPLIMLVPVLGFMSSRLSKRREKINKITDRRISLCQEMFSAMRFVKFFGWEKSLHKRLADIRADEVSKTRVVLNITNFISAIALIVPAFSAMITFIAYSLTHGGLPAARVFSTLALFNALRNPLSQWPSILAIEADSRPSIDRINEFLMAEEVKETIVKDYGNEKAIEVIDSDFTWETVVVKEEDNKQSDPTFDAHNKDDGFKKSEKNIIELDISKAAASRKITEQAPFQLCNINLSIARTELVAIVGKVGSGKSSLLSALASEMRQTRGQIILGASRAFCSQSAWIQNTTVRQNIVFDDKEFDRDRFQKVVDACALRPDLAMWPHADLTELGERGVTVSGGQKQRISIARAIYSNADIVLLDDPLSAVDAHVGKHIFEQAICGLLKDKCRLLVTHQLHVLKKCDRIALMDSGKIKRIDTYDKLMEDDEQFQTMMRNISMTDDGVTNDKTQKVPDDDADSLEKSDQDMEKTDEQKRMIPALMTVEDRAVRGIKNDVWLAYSKAAGSRFAPVLVVILVTFAQAGVLVTSLWLSWWTGNKFKNLHTKQYIAIYAGLGGLSIILMFLFSSTLSYLSTKASKVMVSKAVDRVLHSPMSFFDTTPIGRILNRFGKDVDVMDSNLGVTLRIWIFTASSIIGVFVLIISYYHYIAIALAILGLYFYWSSVYYRATARELKRHESVLRSHVTSAFSEALSGVSTIKAYNSQEQFERKIKDTVDVMNAPYMLVPALVRWMSIRLDLTGSILTLVVGILLVENRLNIKPATGGLVFSYVINLGMLSQTLVRVQAEVETHMTSPERLHYYCDHLEQEAPHHIDNLEPSWPQAGEIVFSNISMRYRPDLPLILNGFNLHVKACERIGIVGRTGAGKSSLMTALFRLTELSSGSIVIDGKDISKLGLADLRSRMSIIPQDPILFAGTVRSNLDPLSIYTDSTLSTALSKSGLNTKGENAIELDTIVVDSGSNFSLGQRQLIALARALVRDSKIIVCDEATSSVDFATDAAVQKTIEREFRGRTLLCIAHRLKTVLRYDRIVVVDQGRVAEIGTPLELYKRENGMWRTMCDGSGIVEDDFEK